MLIAPSIDNFLDTHKKNDYVVTLGKATIAQLIVAGEEKSKLFVQKDNTFNLLNLSRVAETWLGRLFTRLVSGKSYEDFVEGLARIKFVSFNYDRCVQQFFWYAVRSYFEKSPEEAEQLVKSLDVEYVYGSIGEFKILSSFSNFGHGGDILKASMSIKTFTEGTAPALRTSIASAVSGANAVVFLGFRFLPLNLKALFGDDQYEVGSIFATCMGLSRYTEEDVRQYLVGHLLKRKRQNQMAQKAYPLDAGVATSCEAQPPGRRRTFVAGTCE